MARIVALIFFFLLIIAGQLFLLTEAAHIGLRPEPTTPSVTESIRIQLFVFNLTNSEANDEVTLVRENGEVFSEDEFIPPPPRNITCIRKDYDQDVAAIFKDEAGPIMTAEMVFNTTFENYQMGRIFNLTELEDLQAYNETIVDSA